MLLYFTALLYINSLVLPIKNGYAYTESDYFKSNQHYTNNKNLYIVPTDDFSVYSIAKGRIVRLLSVDSSSFFIAILSNIDKKEYTFLYSNLIKPLVKEGDEIKKGDKIGEIQKNTIRSQCYLELHVFIKQNQINAKNFLVYSSQQRLPK